MFMNWMAWLKNLIKLSVITWGYPVHEFKKQYLVINYIYNLETFF